MLSPGLPLHLVTEVRSVARRVGILRPLALLRLNLLKMLGRSAYEAAFDDALKSTIKKNDVVWDVGANVGLYTEKFAEWVGFHGEVVAFEPIPNCFEQLLKRVDGHPNVRPLPRALGATDEVAAMNMADDPLGATHSFANHGQATRVISVQVNRGDSLIRELSLSMPNVIKIDVEGFEEEVLLGLEDTLRQPTCRAVLIEVHFGILDQRGKRQAPAAICSRLAAMGFELRWVDASHLVAVR